jgi:hypothetical protein
MTWRIDLMRGQIRFLPAGLNVGSVLMTSFLLASVTLPSAVVAADARHRDGTLPTGFPYEITVPDNWNGILINDLDAVTNAKTDIAVDLLKKGYAYAGTGRHPERMTRHDPLT